MIKAALWRAAGHARSKEASQVKSNDEARGEARTAFGDDTVFPEKLSTTPSISRFRFWVINTAISCTCNERDCSVQRRASESRRSGALPHPQPANQRQALRICLCPGAPTLTTAMPVRWSSWSIKRRTYSSSKSTPGYRWSIPSLKMTGIDIVRSQILIGMGYPLNHKTIFINSQEDIELSGFAIQCRVTTEDPSNDFTPDYGTLIAYRSAAGMGIRLDAGSAFPALKYRPSSTACWSRSLPGADPERPPTPAPPLRSSASAEKTNIGFLLNLPQHETFQEGKATVNFIKENLNLWSRPTGETGGTKMLRYLTDIIVTTIRM